MFLREARAAGQLNHPHIVQVYDVGQEGDQYFYSMEYIEGCSLEDRLREENKIEPAEAIELLRQAASALEYAESAAHRPSRHQARQLDVDERRHGEDRRPRTCPVDERGQGRRHSADSRHAALSLAGTGAASRSGQSLGHLLAGRHRVSNAHRAHRLRGGECRGDHQEASAGRTTPATRAGGSGLGEARRRGPPDAGKGPGRPASSRPPSFAKHSSTSPGGAGARSPSGRQSVSHWPRWESPCSCSCVVRRRRS